MTSVKFELTIFTIGAYGFTERSFLSALKANGVDTFCDIRQRRGMRGAEYAWANSNRLQQNLQELEINYVYIKELAPTQEIREKQKAEDLKWGVAKRDRTKLGKVFAELYTKNCITATNINIFLSSMPIPAKNVVLFCVEKTAEACHRSLLASHLCDNYNFNRGGDIGDGRLDSFKNVNIRREY